jgi:hypothetical protein
MRNYQFRPPENADARGTGMHSCRYRWLRIPANSISLLVAGGVFRLVSLVSDPISASRPEWLCGPFPLKFAEIGRAVPLPLGFSLVLSAIRPQPNPTVLTSLEANL